MDFKTLVRTVVVKTNPIFPFYRLNRIPYELAIKSIKQLCAKFPEIKSLYLRHGLTRLDWEPGLSDIDLTLVMSSELSQEEEYDFLQAALGDLVPIIWDRRCASDTAPSVCHPNRRRKPPLSWPASGFVVVDRSAAWVREAVSACEVDYYLVAQASASVH